MIIRKIKYIILFMALLAVILLSMKKKTYINLISPCTDGFVLIWDFDSAKLLIKIINTSLFEACLMN